MDKRYESRNRNRRLIVSFEMVVDFVAERHATTDGKTISFDSIARFRSILKMDYITERVTKEESL